MDRIFGEGGHDVIDGGDDGDWIMLGTSNQVGRAQTATGGSGHDWIWSGPDSPDQLIGGKDQAIKPGAIYADQDEIILQDSRGNIYAGPDDDKCWILPAQRSHDRSRVYIGGAGADEIHMVKGAAEIHGDYWSSRNSSASPPQGSGADEIWLHDAYYQLVIYCGARNDRVYYGGNFSGLDSEQYFGEAGNDIINAGEHKDTVRGGPGDDFIYGHDGDDSLFGDEGNDWIWGGRNGEIQIQGGKGADRIWGDTGQKPTLGTQGGDDYVDGGPGADIIRGDGGNDQLDGGVGSDVIHGGNGNDRIRGQQDGDTIYGEDGNDILFGGESADTLFGGAGDDKITGGLGGDKLYGQSGKDILVDFSHEADFLDGGTEADLLDCYDSAHLRHNPEFDTVLGGPPADWDEFYLDDGDHNDMDPGEMTTATYDYSKQRPPNW